MARICRMTAVFLVSIMAVCGVLFAQPAQWHVAVSTDGVPIAYSVEGTGGLTLVFVHGWSCDSRYWQEQVGHFAKNYRVVTVDLAGHGNSGLGRADYTMQLFGQDVKAVVDAVKAERVILIGHSMSGIVIAEAAALLPEKVVGIVGVDTIANVEETLTQAQFDGYTDAFQKDFPGTTRPFVQSMLVKDTDPALASWIVDDMASAPPAVGISAMREMMGMYVRGDLTKLYEGLTVPVRCVNADLWPTNVEANLRHMRSFSAKIVKGRGHFLMLEKPKEFNKLLEQTVRELAAWK